MTIKDVAEYSGVSVSTVSRVLNDHPDVSEAVRAKVLSAVAELHYVPNNSARDLVSPQGDSIGLIVRGMGTPFFQPIIHVVEQAVIRAGYTMAFRIISTEDDELKSAARLARSKRLRGLILLGGRFDYSPEETAALGIPFVCCSFTNSFGSLDKSAFSSVSIDDESEAFNAVSLLIESGHRKIAILLDSTSDHSISELRYRGYCQALSEAGIPLDNGLVAETGTFDMASAYKEMNELLDRRDDFTAVFAIADSMAIAAMKALHEHGKRVPEDCSVIAIDGIEMSQYTVPTLTTLAQHQNELGERAVELLVDIIEGRSQCRQLQVATLLRSGGTVRVI
jgi:LacI family transcriptional regulator